jgi:hypothetical protein
VKGSIRQAALCVNGIHNKGVQRLPIEMLHREWKFKKQHYRKCEIKRIVFVTPTLIRPPDVNR